MSRWEELLKEADKQEPQPAVDINSKGGPTILQASIPPGLDKKPLNIPPGQLKKYFETPREFEEACDSYTRSSWDGPVSECYKPVPSKPGLFSSPAAKIAGFSLLLFMLV